MPIEDNLGLGRLNWIGKSSSATPTQKRYEKNYKFPDVFFVVLLCPLSCYFAKDAKVISA